VAGWERANLAREKAVKLSLSLLALVLFAAPALAQEMQHAPANCPADAKPLPAALANWTDKASLDAAGSAAGLDASALTPGKAATVKLHHTGDVQYVAKPEKQSSAATYGGLLMLDVKDAGTYQVNLSSGAWIDVLKDGAAVSSGAHSHGLPCSDIRKAVQFPLQPGQYVIQLSRNNDPSIAVMVSRVP
jgi:hypothetical protein